MKAPSALSPHACLPPTRLPRGLPEKPAGQGASLLALHHLNASSAAARRLAAAEDSEALHDFRVGLRRLRVHLKAYAGCFSDLVRRRTVKAVRRLARDTNSARDAEVLEGILKGWEKTLKPSHKAGFDALLARALKGRPKDERHFIITACADFNAVEEELRQKLSGQASIPSKGRIFGSLSAALLREAARTLSGDLARIESPADDAAIHEARIAGKHLRYLLEPFQSRSFPCRKAVARLKKLQDDLGEMHDLNICLKACRRCAKKSAAGWSVKLVEAASDRSGKPGRPPADSDDNPVPGLVQLASLAGQDRAEAFKRFTTRWDAPRAAVFFHEVESVAESLSSRKRRKAVPPAGPDTAAAPAEASPARRA
ncbi:MAG: CHAD domain-containing protein [Elusimicrobiota bacterium]|jgi:CHAD domain-containing protein